MTMVMKVRLVVCAGSYFTVPGRWDVIRMHISQDCAVNSLESPDPELCEHTISNYANASLDMTAALPLSLSLLSATMGVGSYIGNQIAQLHGSANNQLVGAEMDAIMFLRL